MDDRSFDTVTRQAAEGISRRSSLMSLTAAGLAALLAAPFAAEAKQGSKKKKKNRGAPAPVQQCPDLCAPQVVSCTASFTAQCGTDPSCLALIQCCDFLGTCDATGFFACANSIKIAL
jgi:hypothetical protein